MHRKDCPAKRRDAATHVDRGEDRAPGKHLPHKKALANPAIRAVFDRSESAWDSLWARFLIQNPCW